MSRIPPNNLEAETNLLGALLLDKEAVTKVADLIRPEDFYKPQHGDIYEVMIDLYERREPIDILSVSSKLKDTKRLDQIGGTSTLTALAEGVVSASHVLHYAQIIQKKSTLRKLERAAAEIAEYSFLEDQDVDGLLDKSEQKLFQISQRYLKQNFVPIKSILTETFDRIDELHREAGQMRGLPTGFHDLDNILAGLQKSDLVILAARPSVGKTTLALDILRHAAVKSKASVGVFSLEMSKEQLVDKLLCSQAGVDLWKMRTGKLSDREGDDDFPRIGQAMGVLSEAKIFIDDTASSNVMEVRTKARRLKLEHGLDLLIVDYLQLMEGRSLDNRVQEIAEITRALKAIARELQVPVLALSQLSRAVESRSPAIPKLADLRESGSIEQDADVVMFIYRRAKDKGRDCPEEERHMAEIHIEKHRNGPTGIVKLFFDENTVSFKNMDQHREVSASVGTTNMAPPPRYYESPTDLPFSAIPQVN
jgi:replicative DNA helicase